MQLQKASRKKVKIKVGIQGPAGSGKTIGALMIAYGITNDWGKIAVIDTENESASLYVNRTIQNDVTIGEFLTIPLKPPYSPENCMLAIDTCLKSEDVEVIIFDSISHEWNGLGGILDIESQMGTMNQMQKWMKLTPRHNKFVDKILHAEKHMICCMRSKQDYVMKEQTNSQGRQVVVPEKVGLKAVTKDGLDYEFTLNFDMDMNNFANVGKDRTALYKGKPEFKISPLIGKEIMNWCALGIDVEPEPKVDKDELNTLADNSTLDSVNLATAKTAITDCGDYDHMQAAKLKARLESLQKPKETIASVLDEA